MDEIDQKIAEIEDLRRKTEEMEEYYSSIIEMKDAEIEDLKNRINDIIYDRDRWD